MLLQLCTFHMCKILRYHFPYLIIFLRVCYLMIVDIILVSGKCCELNSPLMYSIVNFYNDKENYPWSSDTIRPSSHQLGRILLAYGELLGFFSAWGLGDQLTSSGVTQGKFSPTWEAESKWNNQIPSLDTCRTTWHTFRGLHPPP